MGPLFWRADTGGILRMNHGVSKTAVAFDFDQTNGNTNHLAPLRRARKWAAYRNAASSVLFFDGITETLDTLASVEASLYAASSAPKPYLSTFWARLLSGFSRLLTYRSPASANALMRRAPIKFDQLSEIRALQGADPRVVVITDDTHDASAASTAGVPFLHAVLGRLPDGISQHVRLESRQLSLKLILMLRG